MPGVKRILDANANRAREALRVMEDAARFILDDQNLSKQLKQLRHDLAQALSIIQDLSANRDTNNDVGTTITTDNEMTRASAADVAAAAAKRLSEALRSLEEFGKTLPPAACGFAQTIESLRYKGYTLEQQLNTALATGRAKQWHLCVLITESLCPDGNWISVAQAAVSGGADCIQLREKNLDADQLLTRTQQLVALCRPKGVTVILNDRPDIALLANADGVHLGQTDLPCKEARKLVGNQLLIGVSTSNLNQAKQAHADGADYCGLGPMFPTTTKHKPVIAGPEYLKQYLIWNKLPHLAIGGITPTNLGELTSLGVQGIAVSSAICASDDPIAVTIRIADALPITAKPQ
jgi:thiamine-phosphate pyrophosphorylase